MKTIKFSSDQPKAPADKQTTPTPWHLYYKIAGLAGVFFAAFFSIVLINTRFTTPQHLALAEVQKNSEQLTSDVSKFTQWMSIVRENAWSNQPLLQPVSLYKFLDAKNIRGLQYPVPGMKMNLSDPAYMPNAPRTYRNGIHEGVDFPGAVGTKVYAAYTGKIIRIDKNYKEPSKAQYDQMISRALHSKITPPDVLDMLRGRQIWVEHGPGVVTRYCHLSSVNQDIVVGQIIKTGDFVGAMGNSGVMWEELGSHLHFEIRVGDSFLAAGLPYPKLKELYTKAFSPAK
ncbi:MAG: M23 family metallopeptidase [bacterium]